MRLKPSLRLQKYVVSVKTVNPPEPEFHLHFCTPVLSLSKHVLAEVTLFEENYRN